MSKITQTFKALNDHLPPAEINTGEGGLGVWPPAGDHECFIDRIEINDADDVSFFISANEQGMRTDTPATSYRFFFTLCEDEENPESPLEWGGAPFIFPLDFSPLDGFPKKLKQLEISRNRLCGHLTSILGEKVGTEDGIAIEDAIEQAQAMLSGDTQVAVTVRAQYRKEKGVKENPREFKEEFILNLISA
jgi:hypothetical protein